MSVSPARLLALAQLDDRELPGWERATIHRELKPQSIDPRDLDLAERITHGVVKQLLVLQRLIAEYSGRKLRQIDEPVQKILAMSLYQLRAMERVPSHAVVSDAVELTKLVGHRSASAFVNAVLRKAAQDNARGKPLLAKDPAERAEKEYSIPRDLFARLAAIYGEEKALQLCAWFDREPPLLGRLIGKTTLEDLRARNVDAEPHEQPGVVVLPALRRSELRELSDAGLVQVQDATSAGVIEALDLHPGLRVLDRCAGRGTKTQQILERIGVDGRVVAMDTSKARLRSLEQLITRRQVPNATAILSGSTSDLPLDLRQFDRILIDAPCSNSGVLARRPEARYHQEPEEQQQLLNLQLEILKDSADVLAADGLMAYATCSIWAQENEEVIRAFLAGDSRFELLTAATTPLSVSDSPAGYRDGGFYAVLKRRQ